MSNLTKRINKRIKMTKASWKSDIQFSRRYARLRVMDELGGRLGLKKISQSAHRKKEEYIISYLKEELEPLIEEYKGIEEYGVKADNAPIWVCWWTGLDDAPALVQQCVKSIYKESQNHPVHILTQDNITEYIEIPEYFIEKVQKGTMGLAHLADYIRVSVLNQYGGLWLDGTIFCSDTIPEWYFELPFFTCKSEYRESKYLSHYQWVTFCIGGWKGNVFYSFLKRAFEVYWSQNDTAIDYLFFDYLIFIGKEQIPSIKMLMDSVPLNTPHRDDLQAAFNACLPAEDFDNQLHQDTPINKLSWRETYAEETSDGKQSIYGYFLSLEI